MPRLVNSLSKIVRRSGRLGGGSAEQATQAALDARQVAETAGPRVVAAFRARPC
jgi:hypothetical protein